MKVKDDGRWKRDATTLKVKAVNLLHMEKKACKAY